MWLCGLSSHFDIKCIFQRMFRAKSTCESDLRTHTNAIFYIAYNELRLTTIIFQPPRHVSSIKNRKTSTALSFFRFPVNEERYVYWVKRYTVIARECVYFTCHIIDPSVMLCFMIVGFCSNCDIVFPQFYSICLLIGHRKG